MNILVAGGAGYVGSHAVRHLKYSGHSPVILDDLSTGHREVSEILSVPLVVGDLGDKATLKRTLVDHGIEAVMHFAAFALVGESVRRPLDYYGNNVANTLSLLEVMAEVNVDRLIFSSTCAVYGEPQELPIKETEKKAPLSPYGRSKLMVEQILSDHLLARPDFSYAVLRYFNASGASMDGSLGEDHSPETHLIPATLRTVLGREPSLTILGSDYPTPDGTAIRDYVHVDDLAEAHLRALISLRPGTAIECNLGTGVGHSVNEIVRLAEEVTGNSVSRVWGARRAGDAPVLFADADRAFHLLGWRAKYVDVRDSIASAWQWMRKNPAGYSR